MAQSAYLKKPFTIGNIGRIKKEKAKIVKCFVVKPKQFKTDSANMCNVMIEKPLKSLGFMPELLSCETFVQVA